MSSDVSTVDFCRAQTPQETEMSLLTIVIPTRNRAVELDRCLSALSVAIRAAGAENDVVVAIADNFSTDHTREVADRHTRESLWVRYFRHKEPRRTAEESLFHALTFAETDYVWALGDDDVVTENSVRLLSPVLREGRVGLVLLNLISKTPDAEHNYYRFPYPSIFYERGADLFRDFGIISATTTVSCLCFRRSGLQRVDWRRLQSISPIYSHSCALLIAFRDVPALALGEPAVFYSQNLLVTEHERLAQFALERQRPTYHAFTIGLIQLLREVSRETGLPVAELMRFEEPELSKSDWAVKHTLTGYFIAYHLINQLAQGLDRTAEHERFSETDQHSIRTFFEESGDAELMRVVEQALDSMEERSALLANCWKRVVEQEADYFVRRLSERPDRSGAVILFDYQRPFKWSRGRPADSAGTILAVREAVMRLTILIPTFNRARRLTRQLRTLDHFFASRRSDVEILVADNACTDRTARVLEVGQRVIPALRVVHFQDHVGSAEENINRSIPFARGEYVWLLGDDDPPIPPIVELLLHLLDYTRPDCLVFNSTVCNEKRCRDSVQREEPSIGSALFAGIMPLGAVLSQRPYANLLQEFGITTSMAFISRYVLRRERFVPFDDLIRVSRIYSHVFGLARMLHDKQIMTVNYPLVARHDSVVLERFKDISNRAGIWFEFPWTTGLVRLSRCAEEQGWLPHGHLQTVHEVAAGGRYFDLAENMFGHMANQFMLCLESGSRQQLPSEQQVEEFLGYFDASAVQLHSNRKKFRIIQTQLDKWLRREIMTIGKRRQQMRIKQEVILLLMRINRAQAHRDQQSFRMASLPRRVYLRVATWGKQNRITGPILWNLIHSERSLVGSLLRKMHTALINGRKA